MNLEPITSNKDRVKILYSLLEERTPEQSISHKAMPTMAEHTTFMNSDPYLVWYFLVHMREVYGSVYLTNQREIGVSIFKTHQGKGYGKIAVEMLMNKHPGKFLANINPKNARSIKFFDQLGFKLIQNTYEVE